MRQVHITVYANVDSDGAVLDYLIAEPGTEPVDSEAVVWDTDTEKWGSNVSAWIMDEVERRLDEALAGA